MKGLEAHIIMSGDAQPTCEKVCRVPYALKEQVENELDKLEKKLGHKENQQVILGSPDFGDKRLITLLEFAETIRLLTISLNDEMINEINHILI